MSILSSPLWELQWLEDCFPVSTLIRPFILAPVGSHSWCLATCCLYFLNKCIFFVRFARVCGSDLEVCLLLLCIFIGIFFSYLSSIRCISLSIYCCSALSLSVATAACNAMVSGWYCIPLPWFPCCALNICPFSFILSRRLSCFPYLAPLVTGPW